MKSSNVASAATDAVAWKQLELSVAAGSLAERGGRNDEAPRQSAEESRSGVRSGGGD